ncbi:MAG: hypothetical protein A2W91_03855 [Bacteroidetes bacterium GWF2_38_335]|nr:MAG: hypothetical protein A2W91_03855 [Bacteroidetes bacterium GWF2_38_335]OFY79087.1 MAG: hypothetical protein A2281_03190 [Bacteroidetes bacterium RIFOXYA12_FULL_38_20]HBS88828.1 hypothetical protein [Bacteroidales bacterium]
MKKTLVILILIFAVAGSQSVKAQQQPLYSQYMLNDFLLNPAIAGTTTYSPIALTARQQWVGIDDHPRTIALSGHTFLGRNDEMGAGGMIYSDVFGPIARTGVMGTYAYKIRITNKTKLSFGLSLSAFQMKFDESDFNIIDDNDVAFTGAAETKMVPDANFGMYLYNEKYFVGYTTAQMFQFQVKINGATDLSRMIRHHYILAGYKFTMNDNLKLEPSLMLRTTEKTSMQVDINAKVLYKDNYWLGISYRTGDAFIAMIGLKADRYFIGYAFDYTLSNLSDFTYGSHEFLIGYKINKQTKGKTLI